MCLGGRIHIRLNGDFSVIAVAANDNINVAADTHKVTLSTVLKVPGPGRDYSLSSKQSASFLRQCPVNGRGLEGGKYTTWKEGNAEHD
jgi:hypothetical protein